MLQENPAETPATITSELTDYGNLPNKNQAAGLSIIVNTQTGHFSSSDIKKVEQIADSSSGGLKAIKLTCIENPRFLVRDFGYLLQNDYEIAKIARPEGDLYTIELSSTFLERLPYVDTLKKFRTSTDQIEVDHLATLHSSNKVLESIPGLFMSETTYEQRLTNFNQDTKTASGPLKSIMMKFPLWPDSHRAYLKTMTDFNELFIPALKEKLGEANFFRLVKWHGQAVDGKAYLELNPAALKQGLNPTSSSLV